MASGAEWLDAFLHYDFDDSYFNDVNVDAAYEDTDEDSSDLECDSKDEAEFDFVNPLKYVGAIDGTHVSARPPSNATQAYKSRKSTITMNVLCVCNMDIQFTYVHARWEGSANDSRARFPILNLMPKFKRSRQRYVIVACYALHNFIRTNNRGDELFHTWAPSGVEGTSTRSQASGNTRASSCTATQRHVVEMSDAAKRLMTQFRDDITNLI
ncbi:hypothetical protein SO802_023416 [Lithocarpus litseifolius]|uniref:DDE Tnp4 domain-containing protein n=1 Tax=Lithocarpus litseifolius TaxID=425828 RepID=A0AAW2C6W8_9ROSI